MPTKPLPPGDLTHILTHAEPAFHQLRNANLFLTGGTGFFGHWLLESLLHANRELGLNLRITALTRNAEAFRNKSPHITNDPTLTLLEGDIRTFAFPTEPHTHILHAATDSGGQQSSRTPEDLTNEILAGTQHVLDFAHHTGATRLLYTSTGAVYGRSTTLLHTPESFPRPELPLHSYEAAKRAAEDLCLNSPTQNLSSRPESALFADVVERPAVGTNSAAKSTALAPVIARCFAFVGPHLPLDQHFAIGNFIGATLANQPIHIKGDGTPRRSWLYMADLAIWLWTLLTHGEPNRAYNVGSDHGMTIAEAAHLVQQTLLAPPKPVILSEGEGLHPAPQPKDPDDPGPAAAAGTISPIQIDGTPNPNAPLNSYVPSIERARNELNLQVLITLDEALRRTANWLQTQPV
jgi:nucleoside-diphosphate-sugar epimerase